MAEQMVRIAVDKRISLEGGFSLPEAGGRGAALILHPHPLYGGSMYNNVVEALMEAALLSGLAALRLNFRGVGASGGAFSGGEGEVDDVLAAADWLAQKASGGLILMGYSFGALVGSRAAARIADLRAGVWVAPPLILGPMEVWPPNTGPLLVISGDRDQYGPLDGVKEFCAQNSALARLELFSETDHFYYNRESALIQKTLDFLASLPKN